MRELETEHQILIEGLRQEYHDIINNIKLQSKEAQLKHEEELKNQKEYYKKKIQSLKKTQREEIEGLNTRVEELQIQIEELKDA